MIQSQFQSKTGLIELQILDGGTATEVEITSLSPLKYEFDLTPNSINIESFQVLYQKITVDLFQFDKDKNDIYERLRSALLSQKSLKVVLIVDGDSFRFSIAIDDISLSETSQIISINCRPLVDKTVNALSVFDKIDNEEPFLLSILQPDANIQDGVQCAGVKDWIEYALKLIFLNEDETVVYSCPSFLGEGYQSENYISFRNGVPNVVGFVMARMEAVKFQGLEEVPEEEKFSRGKVNSDGTGILTGGDLTNLTVGSSVRLINTAGQSLFFIIDEIISPTQIRVSSPSPPVVPVLGLYEINLHARLMVTSDITALSTIQGLAGIEGSIFGTGFGKNFFINRIQTQDIVEIDWKDVVEFDSEINYNPIGGGFVKQVAKTIKDLETGELNVGTENFGVFPTTSDLTLPVITQGRVDKEEIEGNDSRVNLRLAPAYPFLSKGRYFPQQGRFFGKYTSPVKWDFDSSPVVALCRTGLRSIKRALSSDGTTDRIEGVILGAKKIMPYQLVRFVNAPEAFNLKLFRPTSLEYDFVNDTVTINDYELSPEDVPDPEKFLGVTGSSQSEGSVTIRVGKDVFIGVIGSSSSRGIVEIKAGSETYINVLGESSSIGSVTIKSGSDVFIGVLGQAKSVGVITGGVLNQISVLGNSISVGSITLTREFSISALGESASVGSLETSRQISIEALGLTQSEGSIDETDFAGKLLTTDLGVQLTTPEGVWLKTGDSPTTEISVSGASKSVGFADPSSLINVSVSGVSKSEGSVLDSSIKGVFLTTDLGIQLTTPEGVWLTVPFVVINEVSVKGFTDSEGVAQFSNVFTVEVLGSSVSTGSAIDDFSKGRFLTTDLGIQLTTPEGVWLTTGIGATTLEVDVLGSSESEGSVVAGASFSRSVLGSSRSEGNVILDDIDGRFLTTDLGVQLTTPEGLWLTTGIGATTFEVETSGLSISEGSVATGISFVKSVIGSSQSLGSVISDDIDGRFLTTDLGVQLTTPQGLWLTTGIGATTFEIDVLGLSKSEGDGTIGKVFVRVIIGQSRSDGSVLSDDIDGKFLTTDLGIQLTTPEGLWLTTGIGRPTFEVDLISTTESLGTVSSGSVFSRDVIASSISIGNTEGSKLVSVSVSASTSSTGVAERAPIIREISVQGESRSSGSVLSKVEGTVFISVSGSTTSIGETSASKLSISQPSGVTVSIGSVSTSIQKVFSVSVSGDSLSVGSVSTKVEKEIPVSVSGQSSSAGSVVASRIKESEVEGQSSSTGSVQTEVQSPPPQTPTGLSACNDGFLTKISWNASQGAETYTLQRLAPAGGWSTVFQGSGLQYFDIVPFNSPALTFRYRVRANAGNVSSPYSDEIIVIYNSLNPC